MYVDLNDFLPDPCRIVASSEQEIIVTESGHPTDNDLAVFHVCKPTTKQFQVLPNPESKYYTFKAAIVIIGVKPLHYKIFRLSFSPTWFGAEEILYQILGLMLISYMSFDVIYVAWNQVKLFDFLQSSTYIDNGLHHQHLLDKLAQFLSAHGLFSM
ncbi:hypothetical protein L2E82_15521 [Cichorium intybus]|uniref:Uncharacterized protein n=1 Tax=Cichorium intybus TaxID=13427 RepID=A0ACB9F3F5_CICIN|nr:hypothetical protein L2E82_15521 [Cichorium intybus]